MERILIAFDGGKRSLHALKLSVDLAQNDNSSLVLLTVDDGHAERYESHLRGVSMVRELDPLTPCQFIEGEPVEEILRIAALRGCDQ